jgi:GNAT superfamily N-acetyltransferase
MNLRSFPDGLLDRLMDMDYDLNFALVGVVSERGKESIAAVARYAYSPADSFAELALTVRDDYQNLGLGEHLLKEIIAFGCEHGYRRFKGVIDPGNKAILHILTAYDARLTLKDNAYYADITV